MKLTGSRQHDSFSTLEKIIIFSMAVAALGGLAALSLTLLSADAAKLERFDIQAGDLSDSSF